MSLRTRLAVTFGLLLIAGGLVTTVASGRAVDEAIVRSARDRAQQIADDLARQIGPLVRVGRRQAIRDVIAAEEEHLAFVFLLSANGSLVGTGPARAVRDARRGTPPSPSGSGETIAGRARVPSGGGMLWVGLSLVDAHAAARDVVRRLLVVTGIAGVVGFLMVLALATLLTRPIENLQQAALRMGAGDLSARAAVRGGEEVARLAVAFNAMAQQLAERVDQAERLRAYFETILDRLPVGIAVVGEDWRVRFANRALQVSLHAAAGQPWTEALAGEIPAASVRVALDSRSPVRVTGRRPRARAYEVAATTSAGDEREVIVTVVDVTEVADLSHRLRQAERLAVAGEIAAGIVHAVNNPLDGVVRALTLARKTPDDAERVSTMMGFALEGTDRIATVTRTLLDFARAEAGGARDLVSPNALVEEAAILVRLKAEHAGVRLRLDLARDVPSVLVEPHGMVEAILNLLVNAVDACRREGEVVATTRRIEDADVEISVRDQGDGIPSDVLARIFEPFFTTKAVGQGTGLGLSVTRRIVDAYAGEITVQSELGLGATFRVRLPGAAQQPYAAGTA